MTRKSQKEIEEICTHLNHKMRMKIAILKTLEQRGYDKGTADRIIQETYNAELESLVEALVAPEPQLYTLFTQDSLWVSSVDEDFVEESTEPMVFTKREASDLFLDALMKGVEYEINVNDCPLQGDHVIANQDGTAFVTCLCPFMMGSERPLALDEYTANRLLDRLGQDLLRVQKL